MGENDELATVIVSVKLPAPLVAALRDAARRRGVAVSVLARAIILRYIIERYGRLYVTRRVVIRDVDVAGLLEP